MSWYDGSGNLITPTNAADLGFSADFSNALFLDSSAGIGDLSGSLPTFGPISGSGFDPGTDTIPPPIFDPSLPPIFPSDVPQLPGIIPSDRMPTTSMTIPGHVSYKGSGCVIQKQTKTGRMINYKGHPVIMNGVVVGCTPHKRHMSPCNPHAAKRAVRRLTMVHKFMRSIEKSMSVACRPLHPRPARHTGKCSVCKRVKCTC
jgi:hypothetical protein